MDAKLEEHYARAVVKAKKNLLWFGLFSIVMFFGGLTSAFIVSKGDGFWVSLQLPEALVYSTVTIIVSSITMILAVKFIKKNNKQLSALMLAATFSLGILFGYFQYKGWGEIYEKGYSVVGNIMDPIESGKFFVQGEYGEDFKIFYGGNELKIDEAGEFFYEGKKSIMIDQEDYNEFEKTNPKMVYGSELVELNKEEITDPKTKNRKISYQAVVKAKTTLTENQKADLESERNTAASYFYVLTFAHYLHVIGCLIYLLFMIIKTLRGRFHSSNNLSLKLGGYFWHFLGGLWLYLFLFLYLIH